jgi:hypothetical protein
LADVGTNRQPPGRYPRNNQPGGRRQMPQRSGGQQARLWLLSLCGAVPGAVVVYLTDSFWAGAGIFLAVVVVGGFLLYLYEKRKQQ